MKRIFFIVCAFLFINFVNAQETENDDIRPLFSHDMIYGGYGAFSMGYTEIAGDGGMYIGGSGAFIMNHNVAVGVAGAGFFNMPRYDEYLQEDFYLAGGYGGLLIEPILFGKNPIHFSFPIIVGGGGVAYTREDYYNYDEWDYDYHTYNEDVDAFFIVEPGVQIELNIFRNFRMAIGASYRWTTDITLESNEENPQKLIESDALRGLNVGISFKFGKF